MGLYVILMPFYKERCGFHGSWYGRLFCALCDVKPHAYANVAASTTVREEVLFFLFCFFFHHVLVDGRASCRI